MNKSRGRPFPWERKASHPVKRGKGAKNLAGRRGGGGDLNTTGLLNKAIGAEGERHEGTARNERALRGGISALQGSEDLYSRGFYKKNRGERKI